MPQRTGRAAPRVALWVGLMVLVTTAIGSSTAQQRSEGEETPAGILAVRLRQQGYRCDEPTGAKPDPARSRADERAWVVRCANASYRMRLIPDMGAVIEQGCSTLCLRGAARAAP